LVFFFVISATSVEEKYIGCFAESPEGQNRTLDVFTGNKIDRTIDNCIKECGNHLSGYTLAGAQV